MKVSFQRRTLIISTENNCAHMGHNVKTIGTKSGFGVRLAHVQNCDGLQSFGRETKFGDNQLGDTFRSTGQHNVYEQCRKCDIPIHCSVHKILM